METVRAWESSGQNLPDNVARLIRRLDAHLAQGSLRPYRTMEQIARVAESSFSSLSHELKDSIEHGFGLEWITKIGRLPISDEAEFESVVRTLGENAQKTFIADRLVKSLSELGIDVLETSLFPSLPAETQFRYLLEYIASFGWNEDVAQRVSDRIRVLLPKVKADEFSFSLRRMPSEFLLDFPDFLATDPNLAISLATIALKTSTKNDPRSAPFIDYLKLRITELGRFSDTNDFATTARVQARIILGFHPSLARRFREEGLFAPEIDHLIHCVRRGSCSSSEDYTSIVGHAIADYLLSSENRDHFDTRYWLNRLSARTSAPEGKELETVVLALQDIVIGFMSRGRLRDQAGALSRFLPPCSPSEAPFCEGKPPSQGFSIPFCPRIKKGCSEAIVGPKSRRGFEEISLLDVIGSSVTQATFSLSGKTLINTIAGWVNRLLEVEDRLKCEICNSRMIVDPEYSKKYSARYAATLFMCPMNCEAPKVYLSHCFNCHAAIDSRESRFSYNDFTGEVMGPRKSKQGAPGDVKYLCVHCANDFKPVCPNCGESSQGVVAEEVRTCNSCGHRVVRSRKYSLPKIGTLSPNSRGSESTFLTEHEAWSREPCINALRRIATGTHGWF
jgi:hypothetical protein